MPIFVAVFLCMLLLQADDVSAQSSCVISPNFANLTIRVNVNHDVEFHCQCTDGNGMMITGTRWFNGNTLISRSDTDRPYSTNTGRLIFTSPFTSPDAGTYTCSPDSTFPTGSTGDTITLSTASPTGDRICTIYSTPASLQITNGTQDVILYCICTRDNGVTVAPTIWAFNGQALPSQPNGNNPYYRDIIPTPLIIPSFTAASVGTYGCNSPTSIRNATTNLTLSVQPPFNIEATVLTPRSVEVTWTPSSSPDVTSYNISYTTTASYTSGGSVMVNGNSATSYTLTNLEEDTTYTIAVQAMTNDGRMSGTIALIITTYTDVPSSPPQGVMVTSVNPASLMVSWQPPPPIYHNGMITSYVIQYTRVGSSDIMSVNVTSRTTHTISGLVAYVNYSVIVAAVNVNGTGPFSDPPVVGRSGEDRPSSQLSSLDIVSVNSSSVTLQWSPPDMPNGIITQYSLQYNSTPTVNISDISVLIYTVGGLSPESVYVFHVAAHTIVGAGPPRRITVITPPTPVPDVVIPNESVTSTTLTLTWMEISLTSSDFRHYTVFYLPVSGPYGLIMTSNRRKRQSAQAGELTMNFTGTTGTLTDLYGAVTYRIQVAAVVTLNGQEVIGDRSAINEVTTVEGVPTAPPDLIVMILTNNDVTLTWGRPDPPNGLITQYNMSYVNTNSQDSNNTILPVDNGGGSKLFHTLTNLNQGTYNVSVTASTRTGQGEAAFTQFEIVIPGVNSDDDSDDKSGAVIALAVLFAIAIIGLVICVVINVCLVVKLRHSRYSDHDVIIKQSGDNTITDSTTNHIEQSEPEYEDVDSESTMKADGVTMDANPAYQTTT